MHVQFGSVTVFCHDIAVIKVFDTLSQPIEKLYVHTGVIGSDVPWLDSPSSKTRVITVTEYEYPASRAQYSPDCAM